MSRNENDTPLIIEKYNWIVIKETDLKQSKNDDGNGIGFRIKEGDVIRFGKLCFKIRELSNNTRQTTLKKDKESHKGNNTNITNNNNQSNLIIHSFNNHEGGSNKLLPFKNKSSIEYNLAKLQGINCKICLSTADTNKNPLINICKCIGSVKYVHLDCLRDWFSSKMITVSSVNLIMHKYPKLKCELCNYDIPGKSIVSFTILILII